MDDLVVSVFLESLSVSNISLFSAPFSCVVCEVMTVPYSVSDSIGEKWVYPQRCHWN